LQAIEIAETWARGEGVTLEQVESASNAAYAARTDARTDAAYASDAAAYAARTADAAVASDAAAVAAAYAAYAEASVAAAVAAAYAEASYAKAAYAAYAYAAADVADSLWTTTLKQCADIVRKHYPEPPGMPDYEACEET
jgi:hypothetical protein